ncbi:PREDICTED: uncharacterized protein LOC104762883 [Camelina sativa]|uniref:Uncharacterized protein LOC104762883 n=1 Tax=Camelina sativa TaxID=90675 RepID=A0ABM0XE53_CAMSA|nr:PREDICTED: uncharacterized protein LOC104762883 [Camelina sativa]
MFFSDMERKTLATTPPSFFFHLRGAAFGSSKASHCLLLLSCLLLSSVNTLHNLAEYDSFGSNGYFYNTGSPSTKGFQGQDSQSVAIPKTDHNVCPSSLLFCFLSALGSQNQSDPFVPFFGLSSYPKESLSSSALIRNNLSGVVWLSLNPVHIIEFQPFTGFFHIGDTTCYKPLSKELYTKKNTRELSIPNTRELSILVSGKQCGRNGFVVNHQSEGFSLEPGESIKFLFFYRTELSWASGVAVFALPMKATSPVLMLNLCKKPVFWVRTKKFLIAVLIAVALLILMFCFNDHFIEENNNKRNHMELREVEKPSAFTISPEMDSLLRSITKESLQGYNEVPKNSSVKSAASVSSSHEEEASEAVNLTVKTAKDKKRRRNKKKKKGGINGLTPERTDVSSSHSGNSTPNSPMSPEPPTTTRATTKPVKPPKPVLSHSATFPVSGVKSMIIERSSLAPNVRAPGANSRTEVKEEKAKEYKYDIWGDHLTGLHLMDRFKEVREGKSCSGFDGDECESFFVKGPQNLLANSDARFASFGNQ